MKRKILLLCVGLFIAFTAYSQDRLYVYVLTGEDYQEAIEEIGKMTISDGYMRLFDWKGKKLAEKKLKEVRKITFKDEQSSAINENMVSDKLAVNAYPNPTQDALFVSGLEEGEVIRIFSVNGQLIKTVVADNETVQIEVGSFDKGVYLLQAGVELIKFIKE